MLFIVVHTGGVDVADFLIEPPFRKPNIADAFQQLVEVVFPETPPFFQPLVVQSESLDDVFTEALGRPLPELRATMRTHPVADRDDDIEVVVIHLALNLTIPFCLNYPEFPDSCLPRQFALLIDVLDMLIYRANILVEQ